MPISSYAGPGQGRFVPAENDSIVWPTQLVPGRRAIIYPATNTGPSTSESRQIIRYLADKTGSIVLMPDISNDYGNASSVASMNAAAEYGFANLPVHDTEVTVVGASQGATACLNFIRDFPNKVYKAMLIVPLIDLEDARDENPLGVFRAAIDAAWGVVWPAPLPAGANPPENAFDWSSKTIMNYVSIDDNLIRYGASEAACDVMGMKFKTQNLGHVASSFFAYPEGEIISHLL